MKFHSCVGDFQYSIRDAEPPFRELRRRLAEEALSILY